MVQVLWILLFLISKIKTFEIIEDTADSTKKLSITYVIKEKSVQLQCQSSKPFYKCQWIRPQSSAVCGLFDGDQISEYGGHYKKDCPTRLNSEDGRNVFVGHWSIEKVNNDTCILEISKASDFDDGTWRCELQSYPIRDRYLDDNKNINVQLVKTPKINIEEPGELVVYANEVKNFNCIVENGNPRPSGIKWTIDDSVIEIPIRMKQTFNGKILECSVTQKDSEGNEIITSDKRKITVLESSKKPSLERKTVKSGVFGLQEKYPKDSILLKSGVRTEFYCSSTVEWNDCKWKHPKFHTPCSIFSSDNSRECSMWNHQNVGRWTVKKLSSTKCAIIGEEVTEYDTIQWNCALQSFPLENFHDKYDSIQEFFSIKITEPIEIDENQFDESYEIVEGNEMEFSVQVSNARNAEPKPNFAWYLDGKLHDWNTDKIRYKAKLIDTGKRLSCDIFQVDDERNFFNQTVSTLLKIKKNPLPTNGMSVEIISAIVSSAVLVVLILIIILFLWRTGSACFKKEQIDQRQPAHGNIEVQTSPDGASIGVGADFGPEKPKRTFSKDELREPLLKSGADSSSIDKLLEALIPEDEIFLFNHEGSEMSQATSLSSLDTYVSEKDWLETLQSFGPKFKNLADLVSGDIEESEIKENISVQSDFAVNSYTENEDGSEV